MDLDAFSRRLITLLPQLMRGVSRYESNSLSRGEITLPQLWALEHLARYDGCPMRDVAAALGISRPAATGLIHRLTRQRLVRRVHDQHDRRIVRVFVTAAARRMVSTIWEQKRRAITKVFGQLSARDRAEYLRILERVVETLSQEPR